MKKIFHRFLFLFFIVSCFSFRSTYNEKNIDTIFNEYFSFLQEKPIDSQIKNEHEFLERSFLMSEFLVNITCIQMKRKHDYTGLYYYDYEILENWKSWYEDNRSNLIWIDDNQSIPSSLWDYKEIDFRNEYPFQIRLNTEKDKIPSCFEK